MLVYQIYDQIREVTGRADQDLNFQAMSRAVELLGNKGLFDPLIGYLRFDNSISNLCALPRDVKTVLRVTINGNPTFGRNRLFEFQLNTDGSGDGEEIGWTWADRLYSPVQNEILLPGTLTYLCENPADIGKKVTVFGKDVAGTEISDVLIAGLTGTPTGNVYHEIVKVIRETSTGICLLYCPVQATGKLMALYYPRETDPSYRVIKLSKTVASVLVMYRKHVYEITSMDDVIPIQSKMAVIHATKAVRYYADDEYEKGDAALARAVMFLKEEQAARDEGQAIAEAMEKGTVINRDQYNIRDGVTVADVYDDASEIFGLVGRPRLLSRIGDAVQMLANKTQWDSMTATLSMTSDANGFIALPRYVGVPLAINVNNRPAFARGRLFEYGVNTNGTETGEILGWNWAINDETPVTSFPHSGTVAASSTSGNDNGLIITFIGRDASGAEVSEDITIPNVVGGAVTFAVLTRVIKPVTAGVISVAIGGAAAATYYPDETSPLYRKIRVSKPSTAVKILFKKKTPYFANLYDLIPLKSREAVVNAMRALKAYSDGSSEQANASLMFAVSLLKEEMDSSTIPSNEQVLTAIDSSIRGELVIAADVYDDASEIFGAIGRNKLFDRITDAVGLLANSAQWDSMIAAVTLAANASGIVSLPRIVGTPLAVNISNNPSFARSRLFEYSLNTNGTETGEILGYNWTQGEESPFSLDIVTPTILNVSGNNADTSLPPLQFFGFDSSGNEVSESIAISGSPGTVTFARVTRVLKPASSKAVLVQNSNFQITFANYYPDETEPMYRRIRVSKPSATVKVLFKKSTPKISSIYDFIPLRSREAIVNALRSLKAYSEGNIPLAEGFIASAKSMLKDEMDSKITPAIDQVITPLDATIFGELVIVSDVYDDACSIFGSIGRGKVFDRITDAVQMLANKAQWDSMTASVTLTADANGIVTLPRYAHAPLAVNVSGNPSFSRSRLFEYGLNTNGNEAGEIVGWNWGMREESPFVTDLSANSVLALTCTTPDNAVLLTFSGLDSNGRTVKETIAANATGSVSFSKVTQVSKPVTSGTVTVKQGATTLAIYMPDETEPMYRKIRVSKPSATVKVLFKKTSPRISGMFDFIPLRSRQAVVSAMRAVKFYEDGNLANFEGCMNIAVGLLRDDMTSAITPETDQVITAIDANIRGELVIAADVYDDASDIFGPIGRGKIFDRITDAIGILSNKTQWDSMTATVSLTSDANGAVTLPRFVGAPLAVNVSGNPAFARGRLFEFTLNTNGTEAGERVGWNWAIQEESPVALDPVTPTSLIVGGQAPDTSLSITIYGIDNNGFEQNEVILIGGTGAIVFAKITRVLKPVTVNMVSLVSVQDSSVISLYYPDETTPNYRRIQISKLNTAIKVLFKKKSPKISSLYDFIPLKSREAVVNAMRALKAYGASDLPAAEGFIASAEAMLKDEMESSTMPMTDQVLTAIDSSIRGELVIAADVYDDAASIFGPVGRSKLFDRITDAVQMLRNKTQWDSMTATVSLVSDANGFIALPRFVHSPMAVNIDGNPSMARGRLFEFTLNTNGTEAGEIVGFNWARGDECPLFTDPTTTLAVVGNAADNALSITFAGYDASGNEARESIAVNTTGAIVFSKVTEVLKPVTQFAVTVKNTGKTVTHARYYPDETTPSFRRIRISKLNTPVKVLFKKATPKISSLYDFIPLKSREAVVNALRALKAHQDGNVDGGQAFIELAKAMLQDEMDTETIPSTDQVIDTIDTGINVRDGIVVADVYDDACDIFGPIGRVSVFDEITTAIEVLANKASWDAGLGVVDVWMPDRTQAVNVRNGLGNGYFVLPRFVEAILSLNVCDHPTIPNNRWFEFHLNGTGSRNRTYPGTWEDAGEVRTIQEFPIDPATRLVVPLKIVAVAGNSADNSAKITVFGVERLSDGTEVEVYRAGIEGYQVPCNVTRPVPAGDAPSWVRIDRISRDATVDFVRLIGLDGSTNGLQLGYWYPDELEPKYRAIRTSIAKETRIRILYRKRTPKVTSLFQPIPLRSRLALVNMFRALVAQKTDINAARGYEQMAIEYLSDERINSSPSDSGILQFDSSTMAGFTGNVQ